MKVNNFLITNVLILGAFNISNTKEPTQVIVNVVKSIRHPDYNSVSKKGDIHFKNDLMLVKLEKPLDLSHPSVEAICVPEKSDQTDLYVGQNGLVAGFGDTDFNLKVSKSSNSVLKKAEIAIISMDPCKKTYRLTEEEFNMIICVDGKGSGVLSGDLGAPLSLNNKGKWTLAGLYSYNFLNNLKLPFGFTNVAHYSDWIWDTVKKN